MSQAEDVADQVSSSPRGTRTRAGHTQGCDPARRRRSSAASEFSSKLKVERSVVVLDNRCCVAVNSADRHFVLVKFGEVCSAAAD